MLCHSIMESHQKLVRLFINSFTNSYYQLAKWKLTSAKTSMGHKLLCFVENYMTFLLELWMQSGYRTTCLPQRYQQAGSTFTLLKEHKLHHPEALWITENIISFLSESTVSLREQLQSIEELPKYALVIRTTNKSKTKQKILCNIYEKEQQ